MSGNVDVHDHYLTGGIPAEIAENLHDFFPDHDGLSYEELLLQQASVYQSFQENGSNTYTSAQGVQSSNLGGLPAQEGECSRHGSAMSQEALDEALARSLQELGEDFDQFFISEHIDAEQSDTASGSTGRPTGNPAVVPATSQVLREDDIDPDNMSFEELLTLRETVGVESRGLSEDLISRLPTFKYKKGMFSKNKRKEDCVICQMEYEGGERLITLPCAHQYHSKCLKRWLKLSKNCPICQSEVQLR